MKVSELIKRLEKMKDAELGDFDIRLLVGDSYSVYGEYATISKNLDFSVNRDLKKITIQSILDNKHEDGLKFPKITFRKAV